MLGKPKNALFTLAVAKQMISTVIGGCLMWGIRVLVLRNCSNERIACKAVV